MEQRNYISINIDGRTYNLESPGGELAELLTQLCNYFFAHQNYSSMAFRQGTRNYFSSHPTDPKAHDHYFNAFTPLWTLLQQAGLYTYAGRVWPQALKPVLEWEEENKTQVHKGTPYYFWACTVLLVGDLDRGFHLMHRALEEDERSCGLETPDTPGNAFVTLNSERKEQFLYQDVKAMADYLETHIQKYRNQRNRTLDLAGFQKRFLSNPLLRSEAFLFVYLLFKLRATDARQIEGLAASDFAGVLRLNLLFDFCLVTDRLIKHKYWNEKALFPPLILYVAQRSVVTLSEKLVREISKKVKDDPALAFEEILGGRVCNAVLEGSAIDLAVSVGVRNLGAHRVAAQDIISKHFAELLFGVLNTLFLSIEVLY